MSSRQVFLGTCARFLDIITRPLKDLYTRGNYISSLSPELIYPVVSLTSILGPLIAISKLNVSKTKLLISTPLNVHQTCSHMQLYFSKYQISFLELLYLKECVFLDSSLPLTLHNQFISKSQKLYFHKVSKIQPHFTTSILTSLL